MAAWSLTSWDGHTFGSDVTAFLSDLEPQQLDAQLLETPRLDTWPLIDGSAQPGLTFNVHLTRPSGSSYSVATFHSTIRQWFDREGNKRGQRFLILTWADGSTAVRLGCYVVSRWIVRAKIPYYVVSLFAPFAVLEANTLTVSASNPASITNSGNADARPAVHLTSATHATWKHYTVTGNGAGSGFTNYPYRFDQSDTACTTATTFVFVNGLRVPCYVDDSGGAASSVYALISVGANQTTTVDIVYGGGLDASDLAALDDGGMNWASNSFTNGLWRWNEWAVSSNPERPGVWRPAWIDIAQNDIITGDNGVTRTGSIGIQSEAAGSVVFEISNSTTAYPNTANGLLLDLGGAKAGTSGGLDLYNSSANNDGVNSRMAVYYQAAGSDTWTLAGSTANPGAASADDYQVDNAVRIFVTPEQVTSTIDPSTWTISGATDTTLEINSSFDPTVTLVSTINLDVYDGLLQFGSGAAITFDGFAVPDGTTTIDARRREITRNLHTISDDFDDNDLDLGLWTTANSVGSGATIEEAQGTLRITPLTSTAGTNYGIVTSRNTIDLTGDNVVVEVPQVLNSGASRDMTFGLEADANNKLVIYYKGSTNQLIASRIVAGAETAGYTATYDATNHRWWRIRESGGTTFWDTSVDGQTWTNRASVANPITITALTISLDAGTTASVASPGTAVFDNLSCSVTALTPPAVGTFTFSEAAEWLTAAPGTQVAVRPTGSTMTVSSRSSFT